MWNTINNLLRRFYPNVQHFELVGLNPVSIRRQFEQELTRRNINNFKVEINGLLRNPRLVENLSRDWTPEAWMTLFYMKPDDCRHCPQEVLAPVLHTFNGEHWCWLLKHVPEFADKCDWGKLNNWDNVRQLLTTKPELAEQCRDKWPFWNKLRGGDWASLLCDHPNFAAKCDWSKLDGGAWAKLLCKQPQFADKCEPDWSKLSKEDWVNLLSKQPQFADKCDWSKLEWEQIKQLPLDQKDHEDLTQQCHDKWHGWNQVESGDEWVWLLTQNPKFADKCGWSKLEWKQVKQLPLDDSDLARQCLDKWLGWKDLDGSAWGWLITQNPKFADKCEEHLNGFTPINWVELLSQLPRCNLPQFADKCDWSKLELEQILQMFNKQPDVIKDCHWDQLKGAVIAGLLIKRPEFAAECEPYWCNLSKEDWADLLGKQPQFADKCYWSKLELEQILQVFNKQPDVIKDCHWGQLKGAVIVRLFIKPDFTAQCQPYLSNLRDEDWRVLNGQDWAELLSDQPQFAGRCDNWGDLDNGDWVKLLSEQPQFADKCDKWGELEWEQMQKLLEKHKNIFAEKCRSWLQLHRHELKWDEWRWLLSQVPSLADECNLERLAGQRELFPPTGCGILMALVKNPDLATDAKIMLRCAEIVQKNCDLMGILPNTVQCLIRQWSKNHEDYPEGRTPSTSDTDRTKHLLKPLEGKLLRGPDGRFESFGT